MFSNPEMATVKDFIKNHGPISPYDLETHPRLLRSLTAKQIRVSIQKLVDSAEVSINRDLKLIVPKEKDIKPVLHVGMTTWWWDKRRPRKRLGVDYHHPSKPALVHLDKENQWTLYGVNYFAIREKKK